MSDEDPEPPRTEWVRLPPPRRPDPAAPRPAAPRPAAPPPARPSGAVPRRSAPRPVADTPLDARHERYDAWFRFLGGPEAGQERRCHGPTVRIGANPGLKGLTLHGYPGLAAVQATLDLTAGTPVLHAAGENPVYAAATAEDLERSPPLSAPTVLRPGWLVHLGPLRRGVTLRLEAVRGVAPWQRAVVQSVAATTGLVLVKRHDAYAIRVANATRLLQAAILLTVAAVSGAAAVAFVVHQHAVDGLGKIDEGEERYRWVEADAPAPDIVFEGIEWPFHDFVMAPNAAAAALPGLATDRGQWDRRLYDFTVRAVARHRDSWQFWRRLEAIRSDYARVVEILRAAGLPEVFAGIPYVETGYHTNVRGGDCEYGPWQMLPEVGKRAGLAVRDCHFRDSPDTVWSPERLVPVPGVHDRALYMEAGSCRITTCDTDERGDLARSSKGAAALLAEAWHDPTLAASGAAVQLTISSHNAGYDNSRFDDRAPNPVNILPAYQRWIADKKVERAPDFVGANITCPGVGRDPCGGVMWGYTQHYAYNAIAVHILAACYYGTNYPDVPTFDPWRRYARDYCETLEIPDRDEVRKH